MGHRLHSLVSQAGICYNKMISMISLFTEVHMSKNKAAEKKVRQNSSTVSRSPRKAMAVTLLCAAIVLAGVLATVLGTRYVIQDNTNWAVSGYSGFSTELKIPDSRFGMPVTKISAQAFFLDDLKGIELGKNITDLGSYAFYGCSQLETVKINYGLTTINALCFCDCTSLEWIYIPSTVTYIHDGAFNGCDNLTIAAPFNSYAARFAANNNIPWENIAEPYAYSGK